MVPRTVPTTASHSGIHAISLNGHFVDDVMHILLNLHYNLQAFTAFGPTLIQPTWFCTRRLYDQVGGFSEQGKVAVMDRGGGGGGQGQDFGGCQG